MLDEYKQKIADLYHHRSHNYDKAKAECDKELEALVTAQGILNDITIFFTFGRKPVDDIS